MLPQSVKRYLERLRAPWLFLLSGTLMAMSWLWPDPLPFVDELLLLAITALLGRWRKRPRDADAGADDGRGGDRDAGR
jgi:hypothetical protein